MLYGEQFVKQFKNKSLEESVMTPHYYLCKLFQVYVFILYSD